MEQLECFRKGFPYLKLHAAAAVPDDILALTPASQEQYVQQRHDYKAEGHRATESGREVPESETEKTFFGNLRKFAFYDALNDACILLYGMGAEALVEEQRCHDVAAALLGDEGLGYGSLPKGLLQFHAYADSARAPVEEHLTEAALYASSQGEADVHFTVRSAHRELCEELLERVVPEYEQEYKVT